MAAGVANRLRLSGISEAWRDRLILLVAWVFAGWPWLHGVGFTNGDNVSYFFPQSSFVVQSLLRGDPPWWNPFLHGGQPLLGDPQSMIFTPHTLIGLMLGQHLFNLRAYDIITLSCVLCGGLAMLQYARRTADHRIWPLLGALVFMFGGVASSRLQHVGEIVSYSLLPVALLAIRGACEAPSPWRIAALALSCLALILNLNQVVFLAAFALLPFFVLHAWQSRSPWRAALACAAACGIAIAAASPVLLAVGEFISLSNRMTLPLSDSSVFSFSLIQLPGLVLPGLFGMTSKTANVWSPTDSDSDYLYIGVLPACVLIWSILRAPRLRAPALIALAVAALAFVFALGTNTPIYPFLFNHAPGFSGFHRPADAAFLMNFCIAVLIAVWRQNDMLPLVWRASGPPTLRAGIPPVSLAWAAILLAALAVLAWHAGQALDAYAAARAHYGDYQAVARHGRTRLLLLLAAFALPWCLGARFARAAIPPILVTLTIYDLCSAGRFSPVHVLSYRDSVMARIYRQGKPDAGTLPTLTAAAFLRNNAAVDNPRGSRAEIIGGGLGFNMPDFMHLFTTQGYTPMVLRNYNNMIGVQTLAVEPKQFAAASHGYDSGAYRDLGVHYLLFDESLLEGEAAPTGVTPRLQQLRQFLAISGPAAARRLGVVGAYEVWEMQNAYPRAGLLPRDNPPGHCQIREYRNISMKITCQAEKPATLVIGDSAAPGWSACVNGAPAVVSAYNGFLRSVQVPAGEDEITLQYQPVPLFRGGGCS